MNKKYNLKRIPNPSIFPILKGGPTTEAGQVNTSPFSLIWSSRLWIRLPGLQKSLVDFSTQLGVPAFMNRIRVVALASHPSLDI